MFFLIFSLLASAQTPHQCLQDAETFYKSRSEYLYIQYSRVRLDKQEFEMYRSRLLQQRQEMLAQCQDVPQLKLKLSPQPANTRGLASVPALPAGYEEVTSQEDESD